MPGAEQDNLLMAHSGTGPDRIGIMVRPGKVIGCLIEDQFLLVIGTGGVRAGELTVELNDHRESGVTATVVSWPLAAPQANDTRGFAALVPTSTLRERALATIRLVQGSHDRRYVFAPRAATIADAAAAIAALAGSHFLDCIDSLADALMKGPISRRRIAAVLALLQNGARADGVIDLLGETGGAEIYIQGWTRDLAPGVCRVFVGGKTPSVAECAVALLARQDLPRGASGFVGLLLASEALEASDIEGLLFSRGGSWRYVPVDDRRSISGALETPGHVRSLLLSTRSSPEVLLRLRSAANRFDGSETISNLPLPVRMGIDNVLKIEGGGFLVSGWLLDPDGHVETVRLRGDGVDARLDDGWTRLDRADVTRAFADEPQFRGTLDQASHAHGFVVFARSTQGAASSALHIELALRDARRAFMPLTPTHISPRAAVMRQIGGVDPADRVLPEIIDRQIMPLLCVAERSAPEIVTVADVGAFEDAAGPAIIIGVGADAEADIAALLALLALDPETRRAPLVLALPVQRLPRLAPRLGRLANFYRLSLRLVEAEKAADIYDLAEAGAEAVSCKTIVLMAASLVPREAGWYGRLVAAHEQKKESIISPTLSYEDDSVRWAGSWIASEGSSRPISMRYAGYPVSAVAGLSLTAIAAASFECCIMPREALTLAGGFCGNYLGSQEKGFDLGLRLSRSGWRSYWLPSVQMLGSDETPGGGNEATAALVEQIDRKIFDARWWPVLSGGETKEAQASA